MNNSMKIDTGKQKGRGLTSKTKQPIEGHTITTVNDDNSNNQLEENAGPPQRCELCLSSGNIYHQLQYVTFVPSPLREHLSNVGLSLAQAIDCGNTYRL
jgi:hypothetical protein